MNDPLPQWLEAVADEPGSWPRVGSATRDPVTEPDEPDAVRLGIDETILDPTDVLVAVAPYALIPDDLLAMLRADKTTHPPRR